MMLPTLCKRVRWTDALNCARFKKHLMLFYSSPCVVLRVGY
uniref:Uncharacterized protein n=1 Tax=Anguilla anguilla TaxID=7936 RepID=A0A0E9WRM9_ANGAN